MNDKVFDPKTVAAFLVGGVLVGGIVWMSRPAPTPSEPPTSVVAEVRQVPTETAEASKPEPAPVLPPSKWKPVSKATAKAATTVTPASSKSPAPSVAPAPDPTLVKPMPNATAASPIRPESTAPATRAPEPVAHREPAPAPAPVRREPNKVTLPAGTIVEVRLGETLTTKTAKVGDTFSATLDKAVVAEGFVIAEKGAKAEGEIASVYDGGRVKGLAELHLELKSFRTADGQTVKINTDSFVRQAEKSTKDDAKKVGIGAGIGAAIGAIAGGGKGAAIGAGVGGAAGAGTVLATKGKDAVIPVETRLTFHLGAPVTIVEKID